MSAWWGHEKEGVLVKRLCELGAGSDMYTTSVVLLEGSRGELERVGEEWRERRVAEAEGGDMR